MEDFQGFGLSKTLEDSLTRMGYTKPTPIQAKAIPLALQGKDVLGSAQTGTGKTAAFTIPMIEMLLRSPQGTALVMTPTRELAKQVLDVVHKMIGFKSPLKTAFLIGGESMGKQLGQLRMNPRIIVGTPGRINDHLKRKSLKLNDTSFLVLDETDRMLDMGFGIQIDAILKFMPQRRQTLLFSATMPDAIVKMSGKYLNNPERIAMGATNVVAANIKQEVIHIAAEKKYAELVNQLKAREGSVIIFIKTKHGTEKMAKNLARDGFEADALHGDLKQSKRDRVMSNFRRMDFRILVATDVAARGLDVPHIQHVINYDLPQVAEDYIHRMGRTARAGAEGSALCFVSPQDSRKWHAIEMLINPDAKKSGATRFENDNRKSNGNRSGKSRFAKGDRNRSGSGENRNRTSRFEKGGEKRSYAGARGDQENSARPRGEFKPQGDFAKPRRDNGESNFKPKTEYTPRGEFKPRTQNAEGNKKSRGDFKPAREFQRSNGDSPPRRYKPDGFKPRSGGEAQQRSEGGDRPRGNSGEGQKRPFNGGGGQGEKRNFASGEKRPASNGFKKKSPHRKGGFSGKPRQAA